MESRSLILDDVQSKLIRVRRDLKEICLRENLSLSDLGDMINEIIAESIHDS